MYTVLGKTIYAYRERKEINKNHSSNYMKIARIMSN